MLVGIYIYNLLSLLGPWLFLQQWVLLGSVHISWLYVNPMNCWIAIFKTALQ